MDTREVGLGRARVTVPDGATVHAVDDPPDGLTGLCVIRAELVAGATAMIMVAERRWQSSWSMTTVIDGFADACDPETLLIEEIAVEGAVASRRIDGTARRSSNGQAKESSPRPEAIVIVFGRSSDGMLHSMTLRMAADAHDDAHVAIEHLVASFRVALDEAGSPVERTSPWPE